MGFWVKKKEGGGVWGAGGWGAVGVPFFLGYEG